MKLSEAINYFGNKYQLAKQCKFGMSTPYTWLRRGFVPYEAQLKIEKITEGRLKADYMDGHPNDF